MESIDGAVLHEAFVSIRDIFRHRKGLRFRGKHYRKLKLGVKTVYLDYDVPGTVLDVIEKLWKEPPRPELQGVSLSDTGWHMVFVLPAGFSYREMVKKLDYFADATKCHAEIDRISGLAHLHIFEKKLGRYYPYEPVECEGALPIPVGYSARGLEVIDLAELPHMRVGGTTFTGKSNFLHVVFCSLAGRPGVKMAVIDLALLEFSYVKDVAMFASETPDALKLLQYIEREMHRRRRILDKAKVVNIQEYLRKGNALDYIVLIIDEFAFMNPEGTPDKDEKELRKECQAICSNLAALARKVGIHLVIAMQRPDMKILPGQLKANLPGALSFKTINAVNSEIILDNDSAAHLPNVKGRAIWQVGNRQCEVQVMHLPVEKARVMLPVEGEGWSSGHFDQEEGLPPR